MSDSRMGPIDWDSPAADRAFRIGPGGKGQVRFNQFPSGPGTAVVNRSDKDITVVIDGQSFVVPAGEIMETLPGFGAGERRAAEARQTEKAA